jgi:dTDP-4-amino-4,6-dideoxygalactose transaminase
MNIPILDLKRQYNMLKKELEPAVADCMASGVYVMGENVAEFEKEAAAYIGVKNAVATGSGTDALVISLRACGVKEGDEVITTPFTFFATAEAIAAVGAVPVFADILEDSLDIDPEKLEAKITPKTKAILPVHIFGYPADMDAVNAVAKAHGLYVIEDACQAMGSGYKGRKSGALSDMGCFSFFPTKNLSCFGDGGLITTDNDDFAVICRAMRAHAGGKNGAEAYALMGGKKDDSIKEVDSGALYNPYKYYNYFIAYNSRLDALQAVILRIKLKYLDGFNAKRAANAAFFNSRLDRNKFRLPVLSGDVTPCWHQYVIRTERKEDFIAYLSQKGVGTAAYYPVPMHLQKAFMGLGYKKGDMPIAEKACSQTVALPVFPELTEEELHYIADTANKF